MSIETLVKRIQDAKNAYYNQETHLGSDSISDAEFDALEAQLRKLDPSHPILRSVGADPDEGDDSGLAKVRHTIPMTSLNKATDEGERDGWFSLMPSGVPYLCSEKLDGIAMVLEYQGGQLTQALTRGNGEVGVDITRNVKLMKGVPHQVTIPSKQAFVKGEILVTHEDFATYFPGESNPRNTAGGTAKRQSDPAKCAHLTFMAYNLLPNGVPMHRRSAELALLSDWGFKTPLWTIAFDSNDVLKCFEALGNQRATLGYDIDGMVIELDSAVAREDLGDLNGNPKAAVAFKFPPDEKATTLRGIRWQVGKSGRITPVAEFDSVLLAGANVEKATLHNVSNIMALAAQIGQDVLCIGDQVLCCRGGDVIPAVKSALSGCGGQPLDVPETCPCCGFPLTYDGEYLVCRGEECSAQVAGSFRRWVTKVGVLNVGNSLIETLIDAGMVADIADLYTLDGAKAAALDMNGRRVGGTADKAVSNLNAAKAMPLHTLVGSVGVSNLIGRSMCKVIVDAGFDTLDKMEAATVTDLVAIPGFGPTKAESFVNGFKAKLPLLHKLLAVGIEVTVPAGNLLGKTFVCTEFRDAALAAAIEAQGGTVKDSVSRTLDYLVCLNPDATTGKAAKARALGVKIISRAEANALVGL